MGIHHPASTCRRRSDRQKSAEVLSESRRNRSNEEQLAILDVRLGKNKGASKERARLRNNLAEALRA